MFFVSSLITLYMDLDFFEIILLRVCSAPWICMRLLPNLGSFSNDFNIFLVFHSLFPPSGTLMKQTLNLLLESKSWSSFHFKIFFLLLFRLDNFYWPVFKLSDSFLCCLHSARVYPITLSFLVLSFPLCSSLCLLFLCWHFLFIEFIECLWLLIWHFYNYCFKNILK